VVYCLVRISSSQSIVSAHCDSRNVTVVQVVVHNLPWSITWQELKDIFSHTPGVVRADVIIDSTGRSRLVFPSLPPSQWSVTNR